MFISIKLKRNRLAFKIVIDSEFTKSNESALSTFFHYEVVS